MNIRNKFNTWLSGFFVGLGCSLLATDVSAKIPMAVIFMIVGIIFALLSKVR